MPTDRSSTAVFRLPLAMLLVAVLATAGCVYRPHIQQGNLLDVEVVDQVTIGMTRSQVRYLLGTPMIMDPFSPDRWDYVYTLKRGRQRGIDRAHFVVHFDDDKVNRVEKLDLPEPAAPAGGRKASKKPVDREPPAPPSGQQPQPDAPRPSND